MVLPFIFKIMYEFLWHFNLSAIFAWIFLTWYLFQQNKTVLQHITVPNVLANLKSIDRLKEKCRFYCGDWSNYIENTDRSEQFDYILTSETIYNIENYQKIINIIRTKMKSTGTCYLAAKRHYFGVGGSLRHFKQVLLKENIFNSECVFACDDNVGREVLRITFK